MIPVYLNFVSLSLLISSLFTAVLGFFLLSIPNKTKATYHLSFAFLTFFGLNISYLLGFSVYDPVIVYYDWFILLFAFSSVTHMNQFILYFSGIQRKRFRHRLLIIQYIYSIAVVAVWIPETLSRRSIFIPDGQFWSFIPGNLEGIVSLILLGHILSIVGIGIWSIRYADKPIRRTLAYFIFGFSFLTISPGIANALYMNKIINKEIYQLVYSLITIHGWFVIFIFFLNSTREKVSFLTKILAVTFTTYMILMLIVGYAVSKVGEQAYFKSHKSLAQQVVLSENFRPEELDYIISYSKTLNTVDPVYLRKNAEPDLFKALGNFKNIVLSKNEKSLGEKYIRQNIEKTQNFYAILLTDISYNMMYEVGFNYLSYRKQLHNSNMYVVYILILIVIVLIIGLPVFMHGSLTKPINTLIHGLKRATQGDYTRIPTIQTEDEIGYLSRSFNEMVTTIDLSKQQIMDYTQNLEEMVKERTDKLRQTQEELITAARRAGMADIASNVLHNVGNVLNTVKINTINLKDIAENINVVGIEKARELYEEHKHNNDFFRDPQGKGHKLVEYYQLICESILQKRDESLEVLKQLEEKISAISQIIHAQQQYASGPSLKEYIDLCDAIDQMLFIQNDAIKSSQIQIIKECESIPEIYGHKIKLLHILINLFTNARDAVLMNDPDNRKITIKAELKEDEIWVSLTDNGVGFEKHLATKLFQHGYSTKEGGHGFGLHSCATDIEEMNGTISAISDGPNLGATFTLIFKITD